TAQWQERYFFPRVVHREQSCRGKKHPAGEVGVVRQGAVEPVMRYHRQHTDKRQQEAPGQKLATEAGHRFIQWASAWRSLRFMRVSAPCGQARSQAGPP